ncbi:MAG TPA: serine hydrolase domain-containing protein [Verrucomicrobiae bacterium]|nr:serine hydrolase domain-containing protein [Verrucomicrobiae bacterium]
MVATLAHANTGAGDPGKYIDSLFAPFAATNAPGACVAVVREGKPIFVKAYGAADIEHGTLCAPETDFRLASVTKQFTATAILFLASEKKLSLNETLPDFFPGFPAYGSGITVRHLLSHTSGLPDYEDLIPAGTTLPVLDRDVLRLLMGQTKGLFSPGERFQYSNSGYSLLSLIVEQRSGMPFARFLQERIFKPLRMTHTLAYEKGLSVIPNRAYGYSAAGSGFRKTDQSLTSSVLGDGGIYSCVLDMAKWADALSRNRVLPKRWQTLAFTPGLETGEKGIRYGFGWFISQYRGLKEIWHSGNTIGFTTRIVRFPERKFTVIILANRNDADLKNIPLRIADFWFFGEEPGPAAADEQALTR